MFGSPETTPGGRALKFYSSVRLDVRKIENLKDGTEVVGSRTRVKVVKNKVAPPFRQCEFDIMYGKGISKEGSLIDVGVDLEIVKKSGAWFTYEGEQLGQGRENARAFLAEHIELRDEIERKIREAVGLTVFGEEGDETPIEIVPDLVLADEPSEAEPTPSRKRRGRSRPRPERQTRSRSGRAPSPVTSGPSGSSRCVRAAAGSSRHACGRGLRGGGGRRRARPARARGPGRRRGLRPRRWPSTGSASGARGRRAVTSELLAKGWLPRSWPRWWRRRAARTRRRALRARRLARACGWEAWSPPRRSGGSPPC